MYKRQTQHGGTGFGAPYAGKVSGWASAEGQPYTLDLPTSAGSPAAAVRPHGAPAVTGAPTDAAPRPKVPSGVAERIPYGAER